MDSRDAPVTPEQPQKRTSKTWLFFFGSRRWEFYALWILGIAVMLLAVGLEVLPEQVQSGLGFNWLEVLQLGFLVVILAYLADIRYRLFEEVRKR